MVVVNWVMDLELLAPVREAAPLAVLAGAILPVGAHLRLPVARAPLPVQEVRIPLTKRC